ncbi:hypothetical protein PPACK8108_LOCUS8063 [Phakopsora pachyrhizi]|uniref:Lysophospholipase NTE1 n=1 Tax=Phakopsora pachyrhizi TaxID=170000 RepID=A0AAV0AVI6_PHAPC|nr:hypothetical protein PPACK8108_LOCUS8063 [Phakopsora pachyrhizi]
MDGFSLMLMHLWSAFSFVVYWLYAISLSLLSFATITLPKSVFDILHWSGFISVEINFQKLLILFFLITIISSWTFKLKVLNKYQSLPKSPQLNKSFQNRVAFQDLNPTLLLNSKQFNDHNHFNNYLDEFLSAIRVFGFLEKPVFHELARHLQTRRLLAGDTLSLDEDKSFYIVVDGSVQVFAKTADQSSFDGEPFEDHLVGHLGKKLAYDDEEDNGFQLLNVVESGGTLSSLFTILSLFTEDVKLNPTQSISASFKTDKKQFASNSTHLAHGASPEDKQSDTALVDELEEARSEKTNLEALPKATTGNQPYHEFTNEEISQRRAERTGHKMIDENLPDKRRPSSHLLEPYQVSYEPFRGSNQTQHSSDRSKNTYSRPTNTQKKAKNLNNASREAHPRESTIARAVVDTTLAVIPSEAFKRLTSKFPNAVAHIVQVILTRLQRVTFLTSHQYLGLTKELLRTEKALNELASYPLPAGFFENGGMVRLRQRFMPASRLGDEPFHHSGSYMPDYFSSSHHQHSTYNSSSRLSSFKPSGRTPNSQCKDDSSITSQSHVQTSGSIPVTPERQDSQRRSRHSRSQASFDMLNASQSHSQAVNQLHDDIELRRLVMNCIAKSIGLAQQPASRSPGSNIDSISAINSPSSTPFFAGLKLDSNSASPAPSTGTGRPGGLRPAIRPGFRSGLGSLSYLKAFGGAGKNPRDGLAENGSSACSSSAALEDEEETEDLPNEVEILFFPKDSTLVKAGERNAGLYFVIDGFLDVLIPSEDSEQSTSKSQKGGLRPERKRSEEKNKRATNRSSQTPSRKNRYSSSKSRSRTSTRTPSKSSTAHKSAVRETVSNPPTKLFSIKPGGIAGYLASISSFPSYVDIRAKTDVYVGFLPARALERIMDLQPIVPLTLAKRLISLLSPLMTHIDSALEWMAVDSGQIIFREGEQSDSIYVVIGGRLRAISEQDNGGLEILAEYGQGESIGELDCITNTKRKSTLHAIRDSELVRIPMTLFNAISLRHPAITIQVSRLIASRVRKEVDSGTKNSLKSRTVGSIFKMADGRTTVGEFNDGYNLMSDLRINNVNLKTVAILPNTKDVPIVEFASRLRIALEQMNSTTKLLDQGTILSVLGKHAFSRLGKLKLAGWLTELEQRFRIVLYVADTAVNAPWTQTCIRQADYIMMVCDGGSLPEIGEYERLLMGMKTTARKELVLLHPDRNVPAGSTRPWLRNRPWIHAHLHVEMTGATPLADNRFDELSPLTALKNLKQKVQYQISKYRPKQSKSHLESPKAALNNDFARLARRLCGKSIAVVLGGGGARGISHIGVLRALQEQGLPIDMIGGTSIGSFIGGLYARDSDLISTLGRAKTFSGRMAAPWRILTDITYPVVAYTTGHEFNRGIYKSFYDYHIELPFWANTTNITWSRMEVHTTGYAWRYIRASMSLAGLLPPLCDEGDMLVDGGYIDNLPVSVMLRMGADSIFAVDVGSIDDTSPRDFPESVSGWWLLINKFNPWSSAHQVPTMTDIQSRLTYVSSVKTLEEAKATPGVLYMRMPVTQYTTMDFGKFPEILKKGYEAAKEMLKEMERDGKLPKVISKTYYKGDSKIFYDDGVDRGLFGEGGGGEGINQRRRLTLRRNSV